MKFQWALTTRKNIPRLALIGLWTIGPPGDSSINFKLEIISVAYNYLEDSIFLLINLPQNMMNGFTNVLNDPLLQRLVHWFAMCHYPHVWFFFLHQGQKIIGENFLHEVSVKYSCEFKMARVTLQILKDFSIFFMIPIFIHFRYRLHIGKRPQKILTEPHISYLGWRWVDRHVIIVLFIILKLFL